MLPASQLQLVHHNHQPIALVNDHKQIFRPELVTWIDPFGLNNTVVIRDSSVGAETLSHAGEPDAGSLACCSAIYLATFSRMPTTAGGR